MHRMRIVGATIALGLLLPFAAAMGPTQATSRNEAASRQLDSVAFAPAQAPAFAPAQAPAFAPAALTPIGTGFTYQGRLADASGSALSGTHDFRFHLYDAATAGTLLGTHVLDDVSVVAGLFTVLLDFGPGVFSGESRWLEIEVKEDGEPTYTPLSPRQPLTPAPQALYASGADHGARPVFSLTILRDGQQPSVIIGADGLPLIAYWKPHDDELQAVHCEDLACASVTISAIATVPGAPVYTSVAVGSDGLGLITFYDPHDGSLMAAHCNDLACTSATVRTVDTHDDVGQYSSVAIGIDGSPLISYYDDTDGDLKVAQCQDVACNIVVEHVIDGAGVDVGKYTSLAIGTDGLGLVSYYDATNGDLKVAHCDDAACSSTTPVTLDAGTGIPLSDVGRYTSVTIGDDGLGLISYYEATHGALMAAHCSNVVCSSATISVLDGTHPHTDTGRYTSVTIGSDGLGLISYQDVADDDGGTGDLKVAHCADATCSSASTTTVDDGGGHGNVAGAHTSVTIGMDGYGLIAHWEEVNQEVRVVHCSNTFCQPYVRRR